MSDEKNQGFSAPKKDIEIDRPNFDIVFQMGVLKMSLQDDYFCAQLVRYLSEDKDLDEYTIFESEHLQAIFKIMVESYKEYGNRPTEGQIRQKFNEVNEEYRQDLNEALDNVFSCDTHNDSFYRQFMGTFIQQVKMAKGFKKTKRIWKTNPNDAPDYMQKIIDDIRRVSFEKEDVVTMSDLPVLITDGVAKNSMKIPTGIKALDEDLVGGLPRENLTVILAGTNVGKSMFCISLACNALRCVDENGQNAGFKVLHVNLEGMRDEAIKRYASNLSQVNYGALIQGKYDEAAKKRIDEMTTKFGPNRLMIRNMLGFGSTIEDLIAYCREVYKDFRFDMLVIDYGQLLDSKQKAESYRHTMARVFRGLTAMANEFNCCVITPAQATRGAQENSNQFVGRKQETRAPVMRSTDIAEAMEIARVAGVIVSLNATEDEGKQNRLRLFLEKQRQGAKNKLYGLITNFSQCNLITGKEYDATQPIMEGADVVDMSAIADKQKKAHQAAAPLKFTPKKEGEIKPQEITPEKVAPAAPSKTSQEEELEALCQNFNSLKENFLLIKSQYDDEREKDDQDAELLEKCFSNMSALREEMTALQTNSRILMSQLYPQANKELLEEIRKQYRDAKQSEAPDVWKLEMIIRHYEMGLGINKIPNA